MRGLLDVTDNLRGSEVVPPPDVVRRDDDDPYLVVAADKGTATFSDIANGIAAEYGFWLDDAFASGGSSGYDHKEMAITSRGVWESVKRHFRELGKDIQAPGLHRSSASATCPGDVFGNGMLMSPHIRLLAAFDHRHIFIDPDPDAARSYEERKRLFQLPRSSWADYDRALISAGRRRVRARRQVDPGLAADGAGSSASPVEQVSPAELIQAILLKAEVELLLFGGIGTFVKARTESHADVGDRANDALRVDAAELRAKVIGEGANLAHDPARPHRVRAADGRRPAQHRLHRQLGGRRLLGPRGQHQDPARRGGARGQARPGRRRRRAAARDDRRGRRPGAARQLPADPGDLGDPALGAHLLDRHGAASSRSWSGSGRLDRGDRGPARRRDARRRARGRASASRGRSCAVLLSYSKMALYDEILASDLPDDPLMQEDLKLYFPTPLREAVREGDRRPPAEPRDHRHGGDEQHRQPGRGHLRPRGEGEDRRVRGRTWPAPTSSPARSSRLRELWAAIEALDNKVPATSQAHMLTECGRLIDRATTWFLREAGRPLDIGSQIEAYAPGVQELADKLDDLLSPTRPGPARRHASPGSGQGRAGGAGAAGRVPGRLAAPALDIVRIAREPGPLAAAGRPVLLRDRRPLRLRPPPRGRGQAVARTRRRQAGGHGDHRRPVQPAGELTPG